MRYGCDAATGPARAVYRPSVTPPSHSGVPACPGNGQSARATPFHTAVDHLSDAVGSDPTGTRAARALADSIR